MNDELLREVQRSRRFTREDLQEAERQLQRPGPLSTDQPSPSYRCGPRPNRAGLVAVEGTLPGVDGNAHGHLTCFRYRCRSLKQALLPVHQKG